METKYVVNLYTDYVACDKYKQNSETPDNIYGMEDFDSNYRKDHKQIDPYSARSHKTAQSLH